MVEHFYICEPRHLPPQRHDNIENMQWLKFFYPFTGVKNLYQSEKLAPSIAHALQLLVNGRMTKVLPALQNIFLEGLQSSVPVLEGIGKFFSARQLLVTV
jgi:hypothetical protein